MKQTPLPAATVKAVSSLRNQCRILDLRANATVRKLQKELPPGTTCTFRCGNMTADAPARIVTWGVDRGGYGLIHICVCVINLRTHRERWVPFEAIRSRIVHPTPAPESESTHG